MTKVRSGLDNIVAEDFTSLKGAKVGLLANQATVDSGFRHAADLLHKSDNCNLVKLFAPEHGFRGELQDMDSVADAVDPYTNLPVRSLYGSSEETLTPKAEDLKDLDILVVDLPDIGSRYYTFAQSLGYCMKVAKEVDTKVLVLDRPNPINGVDIEGAALLKDCRSFCGYAPVGNRHGLTLGELAELMNKGFGEGDDAIPAINCDLGVSKISGWKREMYFEQTGLPWVLPSPNMPTIETAVIYPGSCLFEATEISEGRGTTKPLEMFGAPYIGGRAWSEAIAKEEIKLEGAVLRPINFLPKFQKHANTVCGGVQLHVTDRKTFKPFRWSLALIAAAYRLYPEDFSWRGAAFEFVDKVPAIDLLFGSPDFRTCLENNQSLASITPKLEQFESWFSSAREEFLLY